MMRKPLLAAILCALLLAWSATPAIPQTPGSQIKPLGYCQLSVTTAVQTSTCSGFPTLATYAAVCNEGSAARWRDDGTAPTTTLGQPLGSGTPTVPTCQPMATTFSTLQWVAQSGTAIINFTFYK